MSNTVLSKTLLLLFLLQSVNSRSQLKFSINPEIGYVYGGKDRADSFTTIGRQDHIDKYITNKSGFLAGLQANFTLRRFICFSAGIQYQEKGSTYIENRMSPGITNGLPYLSKEIAIQEFKKICFPLSAGFTFRIWRLQPAFFAGIRPNYFFYGRYSSSFMYNAVDPARDYTSERAYNPLEHHKPGILRNQLFYGVSVLCFSRLKVSFSMTKKSEITYGFGPMSCYGTSLDNHDYIFSLSWFCIRPTRCMESCHYKTARFL